MREFPMFLPALALAIATLQQPSTPELPVIDAKLGSCSADFTVKDAADAPVYDATMHVRIRYGFMSVKRMDLEVGTNSAGLARVVGLPENAKLLTYEVVKGNSKKSITQDVPKVCKGTYGVSLAP